MIRKREPSLVTAYEDLDPEIKAIFEATFARNKELFLRLAKK